MLNLRYRLWFNLVGTWELLGFTFLFIIFVFGFAIRMEAILFGPMILMGVGVIV